MQHPWGSFGTTPGSDMRYASAGDWHTHDGQTDIIAAETDNDDYNFLVLYHELLEWYLCKRQGITDAEVTAFDTLFEQERVEGKHTDEAEPGDDPRAPYRKEHGFATRIEHQVAAYLRIDWEQYEAALAALELPDATASASPASATTAV